MYTDSSDYQSRISNDREITTEMGGRHSRPDQTNASTQPDDEPVEASPLLGKRKKRSNVYNTLLYSRVICFGS